MKNEENRINIDKSNGFIYGIMDKAILMNYTVLVESEKYGNITIPISISVVKVEFKYETNELSYYVYTNIITPTPSSNKVFDYYTINPSLPNGLSFDSRNGQIYGKINEMYENTFTISGISELNHTTSLSIKIISI